MVVAIDSIDSIMADLVRDADDSMDQECTQPIWDDTEDQDNDRLGADAGDTSSNSARQSEETPRPWGKLIAAGDKEIILENLPMHQGRCNQYLFGRTKKNLSLDEQVVRYIEVSNAMVSAQHCMLYCVPGGLGQKMSVFVNCLGLNGIIIHTRSGHEVPIDQHQEPHYRLHTGDRISLVKDKNKKDGVCSTFYFVDMQQAPSTADAMPPPPPGMRSRSSTMSGGGSQGSGTAPRRFEDFYSKEDEVGEGTCGKVYKAIEHLTMALANSVKWVGA